MRLQFAARTASAMLLVMVIAGCASNGQRAASWPPEQQPKQGPAPVQRPIPITPVPTTPQQAPVPAVVVPKPVPVYPKTAEQISGQAVVSLIRQSQQARAAGKLDQAAPPLERALKIEPRNYFVWSALASLYVEQKQFDQAEGVALKSNSLARGNIYVELENWRTIAIARQATGNPIGALQAQARIDEIQRQLAGG